MLLHSLLDHGWSFGVVSAPHAAPVQSGYMLLLSLLVHRW